MARGNSTRMPGDEECTLCIDRIYNDNLAEEDQLPACVMVCPVSARHFRRSRRPDSEVSQMVAQATAAISCPSSATPGQQIFAAEAGRMAPRVPVEERAAPPDDMHPAERLLRWVDRLLSR